MSPTLQGRTVLTLWFQKCPPSGWKRENFLKNYLFQFPTLLVSILPHHSQSFLSKIYQFCKKKIWFLVLFLISSAANSVFFYLIYINWYCFYFMTSHPTLHVMQFRENRRHSPVLSEALGGGLLFQWKINFANIFWWFFSLIETPPLYKFCSPQKMHPAHWSISQVWIFNLSLSHAQGVQNLRFLLDLMSTQNHL